MYQSDVHIRVRYAETDQMGYVYHGNFAAYFEVARTEAFRHLGISYREMEAEGVGMPVGELRIKYKRPARYDDLLRVRMLLREMPQGSRVLFEYEVYNEANDLLAEGSTLMVFVNGQTGRPTATPAHVLESIQPYFNG